MTAEYRIPDRSRRQRGLLGMLALQALCVAGCPQLLDDEFSTALPAVDGGVPDTPRRPATPDGGIAATSSADASDVPTTGDGPAAAGKPALALGDAAAPGCVPSEERCDGRDNDCDSLIDEPPACPSECVGFSFQGHGAMYCGGAGDTFAAAEARCAAQGLRVLVIDSAEKNAAVVQAVPPRYAALSTEVEDQNSVWIDAHDGETEGIWRWGTTGTVFWLGGAVGAVQNGAYVHWASAKPNNNAPGPGEDCAVIYIGDGGDGLGYWNDYACDSLHTVLCEAADTP